MIGMANFTRLWFQCAFLVHMNADPGIKRKGSHKDVKESGRLPVARRAFLSSFSDSVPVCDTSVRKKMSWLMGGHVRHVTSAAATFLVSFILPCIERSSSTDVKTPVGSVCLLLMSDEILRH